MQQPGQHPTTSTAAQRTGLVLAAIAVLFLLVDGVTKVMLVQPVVESMAELGYPTGSGRGIGLLLLCCLTIYVVPRTAILGAVLLTGYLGGAIATHVRVESPLFSHTLFPAYVGILVWAGLYLRDARLRELLPFQR